MQPSVPLAYRPPFTFNTPYVDERLPGESILEMVLSVPNLPPRFMQQGVVCINGEMVPNEMWAYVRPKPTSAQVPIAVTLHYPLQGGGGGGGRKQILGIVAAIALLVVTAAIAAPAVGGALLGSFGTASFLGITGAQAVAGAVAIGGALAISALTAPPLVQTSTQSGSTDVGNIDNAEAAAASGNLLDRGGAIPRVVGTRKVFPPLACEPVVELVDQDEYVEALFVLNGPHAMTDIRIEGVDITDAEDVEYETREGWFTDTPVTLVTRQGRTLTPQLELSIHSVDSNGSDLVHQGSPTDDLPVWHGVVSRNEPDEIWLHLLFPGGISFGDTTQTAVPLRVRFRKRGVGSPPSNWVNVPELHVAAGSTQQLRTAILFKWETAPAIPQVPEDNGFVYANLDVPPQTLSPATPVASEWNAHSYFDDGSGDVWLNKDNESTTRIRNIALYTNRCEIFLNEATFPKGIYEIEIKRGDLYERGQFIDSTYEYTPSTDVYDFFWYFDNSGTFQTPQSRLNTSDRCALTRVVSIWNEAPIQSTGSPDISGFAQIAVKALNRSVRGLSVSASGYVRDWDGSGWNTWTTTSNPAPHYADVLCGAQNIDPLPTDLRDDDSLVAWRSLCATNDWTCDAIINDSRTQDVLSLLASCGYARPYQCDVYGVTIDNDRSGDSPVQIFSRRNAASVQFERAFARVPAGFNVTYRDEANDDDQAQVTVYQSDSSVTDLTLLESMSYDGLVSENKVIARAQFDLDQANLRSTFYRFDTDIESIVCRRGDLVGLEHDMLTSRAGDGYIVSKQISGGNITGVTLDAEIPVTSGDTGLVIRRTDGTLSSHSLSNATGSSSVLTFTTPIADVATIQGFDDNNRQYGCLAVAGALSSEYRRLLVHSITPTRDLQASLVLVDEAPSLVRYSPDFTPGAAGALSLAGAGMLRAHATQVSGGSAKAGNARYAGAGNLRIQTVQKGMQLASVRPAGAGDLRANAQPSGGSGSITVTTPGDGTWEVPLGITSITIEAWGGGAGGAGTGSTSKPGGGGGGYAKRTGVTVSGGQTIYYSVGFFAPGGFAAGSNGQNSWINPSANSQPVASPGIVATGGSSGTTGNPTGGSGTIAATSFTGGSGGDGAASVGGGGGGGAGSAGNGTIGTAGGGSGGAGGAGGSPDGGAGGAGSATSGSNGTQPGGGGGGGWAGVGGAGQSGQIRITW